MIIQEKERPLNIYRASAGSGKTHLLTGFYIKLLFRNELCPETHSGEMKFSEILAVTFTNKATAEMKGRIIEELHLLSQRPRESHYWDDLTSGMADDAKTEAAIRKKATRLLVQVLNEYSQFNISTIDSFFQRIVRSFARELNIPGNYEVELDGDRVLDAAVSNFLDKLDQKQDPELFGWMESFSQKRIEEGSGWDFRSELMKLAKGVLQSEAYRAHSTSIREFTEDKKALRDYAQMLEKIQREWRDRWKELGQRGKKLLEENALLPADFKYSGSGSVSFFDKMAEGSTDKPSTRFINGAEDPETMWKKKGVSENLKQELQELMQEAIAHISGTEYRHYMTACAIRHHFYELGILANIDKEMIEYCNEQNFMLLSSTTEMLSRLIDKDDAPFIYEKTGSRIHAYMIDEFQDTSGMQWGNFKPLVSNALSEQYQNLIVGDVKQSIYRWRGGDWNLLDSEINDYEPLLHHDDSKTLTVNWRSNPAIVDFNNDFFPYLSQQLDGMLGTDRIARIYGDVEQQKAPPKVKEGKPKGLVHIGYLKPVDEEGELIEKPKKEDFIAEASRRLPEVVIELQKNGYRPKDIAILCRKNKECQWAAEALLKYKQEHPDCPYGMDIISGEALQISVRPCIQTLISLMRHLQNPESEILCTIAWSNYLQLTGLGSEESLEQYFAMEKGKRLFHPELAHRPLYEMTEELIGYLPEEARRRDDPFLQAFRDLVLEFAHRQSSDLAGFLDWWEQKGATKTITTPEGQDAILIMSVHKSKGLGMPAIVMPYASWGMDLDYSHGEILWCEPKEEPFAKEVLLPIKLEKQLEDTIFVEDFNRERQCAVIDNLNTAYVAFTRAKEAMVILTPYTDKAGTGLECWLRDYCISKEHPEGLTLGDWNRGIEAKEPEAAIEAQALEDSLEDTLTANTLPRISILHDPEKPDVTAKERGTYIHAVLQEIRTADEAMEVIMKMYKRGDVDPSCISQEEMEQTIGTLLEREEVAAWFRPGLQVLNELTLMDRDGDMQRPDRIVIDETGKAIIIDYKTGAMHPGYRRQVKRYMRVLKDIGFKQVEGWLLFLKDPITALQVK